ncbi:MAG: hypothetical protein IJA72_05270 [Clostridia bacterium]|nr:hypothetical protein [Clostridia bacterium]
MGKGNYSVLVVYNYAETITQAIKNVRHFPMVKHEGVTTVLASKPVDELEFVVGVVQNAYSRLNLEKSVTPIDKIDKILSYVQNYEFQTEEGKMLESFSKTFINASAKVKPMVEREYEEWASDFVNTHTDDQVFWF